VIGGQSNKSIELFSVLSTKLEESILTYLLAGRLKSRSSRLL
jgi:hypothetical protein